MAACRQRPWAGAHTALMRSSLGSLSILSTHGAKFLIAPAAATATAGSSFDRSSCSTTAADRRLGSARDAPEATGKRHTSKTNANCRSNASNASNISSGRSKHSEGSDQGDECVLQQAVERSFSIFDHIYRCAVSAQNQTVRVPPSASIGGRGGAANQIPSDSQSEEAETTAGSATPSPAVFAFYPSSKSEEGPPILLSLLRDLKNSGVRTEQAWGPPLLSLLQQLPLLSAAELQQTTSLLAAAGCRPPLVLQGLCEAFSWRGRARQVEADQVVLLMDALRRLRSDVFRALSCTVMAFSVCSSVRQFSSVC